MGAYLFFIVCTGLWIVFGWALATRPVVLDRAWVRVRGLPLVAKPVVWIAFFPWLSGLAVWESSWGTPHARRMPSRWSRLAFIVFWASLTFRRRGDPHEHHHTPSRAPRAAPELWPLRPSLLRDVHADVHRLGGR